MLSSLLLLSSSSSLTSLYVYSTPGHIDDANDLTYGTYMHINPPYRPLKYMAYKCNLADLLVSAHTCTSAAVVQNEGIVIYICSAYASGTNPHLGEIRLQSVHVFDICLKSLLKSFLRLERFFLEYSRYKYG